MTDPKRATHATIGRPPLAGQAGPASVRLTLTVTAAQRLELRRVADRRGVRIATVVRAGIDRQLDDDDDDVA